MQKQSTLSIVLYHLLSTVKFCLAIQQKKYEIGFISPKKECIDNLHWQKRKKWEYINCNILELEGFFPPREPVKHSNKTASFDDENKKI